MRGGKEEDKGKRIMIDEGDEVEEGEKFGSGGKGRS